MAKKIIGKRITLQIGGEPPKKDDDAIVGQDVTVHVPEKDLGKYNHIVGEQVELRIVGDIDSVVTKVLRTIDASIAPQKEKIASVCREILSEQDQRRKIEKANMLISMGSGVATIAQFLMQLKGLLGL
jgi:predicted nucleic acid-binding Zn ribbon protein